MKVDGIGNINYLKQHFQGQPNSMQYIRQQEHKLDMIVDISKKIEAYAMNHKGTIGINEIAKIIHDTYMTSGHSSSTADVQSDKPSVIGKGNITDLLV